ncbi:MAG: hypothetical protein C0404_13635 [Verrucomicrobia bacterium]|nr:hypothetical protein [Verrucomicrobiota bacterium]
MIATADAHAIVVTTDKVASADRTQKLAGDNAAAGQLRKTGLAAPLMPNGDPPMLMLWGTDEGSDKRKTG